MTTPMPVSSDNLATAKLQDSLANDKVLQRTVPWEALHSATVITSEQLDMIRHFDVRSRETQDELLDKHGKEYAHLFLTLTTQITKGENLQYVLALLDNLLSFDPDRAVLFLAQENPYQPFLRVLHRADNDKFTGAKASKVLAHILTYRQKTPPPPEVVSEVLRWCGDQLRQNAHIDITIGLTALQVLLKSDVFRVAFHQDDGLNKLAGLLRSQSQQNFQLLYQAMYCLWLMSYHDEIAATFHTTTVIRKIVETIKQTAKEKVIRVGLATLNNLSGKGQNNEQMIESGCMRVLENLGQRKWGDEDIIEDLECLTEHIKENIAELSSFEMYKKEVLSGNLEWTPVHRSERFWRENIMKFEERNFELLGMLVSLLNSSQNTDVLAVASYDIGEFVRHHPRGRQIVQGLGAKVAVMKLMAHKEAEVQKQALLCVQKMMVVNWEYIAK